MFSCLHLYDVSWVRPSVDVEALRHPGGTFVSYGIATTSALGPAAKRFLWNAANSGGGTAAVAASR